jgi:uracil-DNA glycosylase family 4
MSLVELPQIRNAECNLCNLGADRKMPPRTVCLMPKEIEHCDIMLVAENPSANEDTYGTVFTSSGLAEIKKFFEDAGFSVYCTFAVKCAKLNKAVKIKPEHVKACRENYLYREIEQVRPDHIITFGAGAWSATTRKGGLTENRGNRHLIENITGVKRKTEEKISAFVYPTVHHMQARYNEEQKRELWADLNMFLEWIKTGGAAAAWDPPVKVCTTVKALRRVQRMIREAGGIVAVDTETQGLNPYDPDANVRCIQFCWDEDYGGVFLPLFLEDDCYFTDKKNLASYWDYEGEEWAEILEVLREMLFEFKLIWHNGKFDRVWLYEWGRRICGIPFRCPNIFADTMHLAYLLNENRRLGLKKLETSVLGIPSHDIKDKLTKNLDELIPYATKDTIASLMLCRVFLEELSLPENKKLRRLYTKLMRRADSAYTAIELRGWPVNKKRSADVVKIFEGLYEERVEKVKEMALEHHGYEFEDDSVLSSPTKLAPVLFTEMGYKPTSDRRLAYTESGNLAVNEDALIHLKGDPVIDAIFEMRRMYKALSTYARPFLEAANTRGRITTSYKLAKVVTGRTASGKEGVGKTATGMNLQNLPKSQKKGDLGYQLRSCIKAEKGWVIAELDFSQIELRVMGFESRDPMLLHAYQNDIDLHTYRAKKIVARQKGGDPDELWDNLSKEDQKKFRYYAKPVNFLNLYGGKERVFMQGALKDYNIEFSFAEAQSMREGFFEDHYMLPKYYKQQERLGKSQGYVEAPTGRRRRLLNLKLDPDFSKESKQKYEDAVRQAINSPTQGFASDLKQMALVEIDDNLNPEEAYVFGEVHDSILLCIREDCVAKVVLYAIGVMENPAILKDLKVALDVPLRAEASIGPSLGETEEVTEDELREMLAAA